MSICLNRRVFVMSFIYNTKQLNRLDPFIPLSTEYLQIFLKQYCFSELKNCLMLGYERITIRRLSCKLHFNVLNKNNCLSIKLSYTSYFIIINNMC